MSDSKPKTPAGRSGVSAPTTPQDYYSVLRDMIEKAANDPAQIRHIVYALAWHHFRAEAMLSPSLPNANSRAKTIWALERAVEIEDAIARLEGEATQSPDRGEGDQSREHQPKIEAGLETLTGGPPSEQVQPSIDDSELQTPGPSQILANAPQKDGLGSEEVSQPSENAVIVVTPAPAWMHRVERTALAPRWPDSEWDVAARTVEYGPIKKSGSAPSLILFIQLAGAAVLSVALFVGIFGWLYVGRPSAVNWSAAISPQSIGSLPASKGEEQGSLSSREPQAQPVLPFPLPKTYGIYVGSNGQLTELEPLPVKIPDARVQLSAEITKPSRVTVSGNELAFVVFRRDLVNSAPQTASVRVVASVMRETKFVDRKVQVVPVEQSWRIRSKAFEFKVSPVEGSREMILIRPPTDFSFPAGRYALVLNGVGYDFVVAGPITAAEQCLEQMEALNGTVLSECRKP
jgi:hypothetical protein